MHPSKCQAQSNLTEGVARGKVDLEEGLSIEVVEEGEGLKVLGTKLYLTDCTSKEVRDRVQIGWRKFFALSRLLMNQGTSMKRRFRLWNATVTKSVLWCSESWAMTVADKKFLQAACHKMMRRISGLKRRPGEDWVSWVQRTTRRARKIAKEA